MKINSQNFNSNSTPRVSGVNLGQHKGFQKALAAQMNKDTFAVSDKEAYTKMQEAASAEIKPNDTTLVKLVKLKEIAANTDFSGMSYTEIYTNLWKSYDDAFGGNMPAIMSGLAQSQEKHSIHNQFMDDYEKYVSQPLRTQIFQETGCVYGTDAYREVVKEYIGDTTESPFDSIALGYGGMSIEEKEAAIYQKYAGKNTLQDFLNMQGELWKTGVLKHKMGGASVVFQYRNILDQQLEWHFFPDNMLSMENITQSQWDSVYNTSFDAVSFLTEMKDAIKHMSFSNFDFNVEEVLSQGIDDLLNKLAEKDCD